MDYTKEFQELKAKRSELEAELKTKGFSEQERIVIRQQIIAIDSQITALLSKFRLKVSQDLPQETKTIQYFGEDGELFRTVLDESGLARWLTNAYCLVPIDSSGNELNKPVHIFQELDENLLYRLHHHPLDDIKAHLQHLTDINAHEFGKSCEQFIREDEKLSAESYNVLVASDTTKKGKHPLNEFVYRYDAFTEVDFYAKNGTSQVVGMFQLIPPSEEKLKNFMSDQEKLREAHHFLKSYSILGVAFGNTKFVRQLSSKFCFHAAFVRSAKGFVKL